MKKWVIALMAVALLSGCGMQADPAETTAPPAETTVPAQEMPSCYVEDSVMERGTGGVVKQFSLDTQVYGVDLLGENLLVRTDENTMLLLDRQTMSVLRERQLYPGLTWKNTKLVISDKGVAYYDPEVFSYVILDTNLMSVSNFEIGEKILAGPMISPDFDRVYFAASDGIRMLELSSGRSRLIREEHNRVLTLVGMEFDNTVLHYIRQTEEGVEETCFIDAETGSLYRMAEFEGQITTWGRQYAGKMTMEHPLGQTTWLVAGDLNGQLMRLNPENNWDDALLLDNGWAVLQYTSQVGLTLYCYDLSDGHLVSQVTLPQQYALFTCANVDGENIWFCDGQTSRFFRWDTRVNRQGDAASAFVDYASLDQPDTAGIAECVQLAQVIGERYGVEITLEDAQNRTSGEDYSGYPDFRADYYNQALRELEQTLRRLPEGFLRKVGRLTETGSLEIILVDDYDPMAKTTPATGSMDVSNGEMAIRISICQNQEEIFLHELFHVMEVQILNVRVGFKWWEYLNPEGFEYVNSYEAYYNGELRSSPYLTEGNQYFADDYGLISAREDRAQVFLYACMSDQRYRFSSTAMQKKLGQISDMLRACYGIADDVTPIWEQYLMPEPETTDPAE